MTLPEFYDELARHDWHFAMSDSGEVYLRGLENASALAGAARTIPGAQELLTAYALHKFSGPAFGTEKKPKPERPKS